jgi:PAS domain S-box-containing protein
MSTIQGTSLSNSIASVGPSNQLTSSVQQLTETDESESALRESKFRLQLAVDSANIGIYELNLKNGELLLDDRVRAHGGLPPGAPVDYNTFLKAVHPDDREVTQAAVDRALDPNGDGRCRVEFRVIGIQDGIERWIVGTGQVFFENCQAERLVGTTFDITARKHAEQRLRESEERFRTLADSSPVPIWVTDAGGGIEFLNAAYCDFFGVTIEDVRGPKWATLLHPDDADSYVGAHYEALHKRKPFRAEARVRRRDGEWRWVDTRGVPRFSEGGEFLGHVGSSPDVTEMKIAQQALRESEEQFRASFEISTVGMAQGDPITGRLLRVNRRYCEMTGYSEAELLQLTIRDIAHPEDRTADFERFQRLGRGEVSEYWAEKRYLRKDGKVIWVAATANLVRNASGQPTRTVAAVIDITGRKQAEAALRESEAQFRTSFELAAVGQAQVNSATGRFERVNQKFCEIVGYSEEELLTMAPADTTHPEDRQSYVEIYPRFLRGEIEEYVTEKRDVRKDQTVVWVSIAAKLIRDSDGRPLRTIGVLQDITERKRAEEELKEADRRKDEFIATLAHELRNPLAPIRNAVEMLGLCQSSDPDFDWGRNVIDQQVKHLACLVDDLIDVSRITRNRLVIKKERVSLTDVINGALDAARLLIEQRGHLLTVALPTEPIYLNADPVRLTQIFMNLINNAAKYTHEGGRIWVDAERKNANVTVRIADNGVGISTDELSHLFDMFYQVDRSYDQAHGGLGIGLTLVKRLVEMHGGTVEAKSAGIGQGSEFLVSLPMLVSLSVVLMDKDAGEQKYKKRRRILVVDDYPTAAESLARSLKRFGNEVETALDGIEGIKQAEKFRPDVVLLDIGMPKLNGYKAAQRIREQPWGKDMVLIAITGWGQEEDRQRTREAGFDAHLVKPVDYTKLGELLEKFASPEQLGQFVGQSV